VLRLSTLPPGYVEWSFTRRLQDLTEWRAGRMPPLAGPHCAMVASYGATQTDSAFRINNAVKGIGWLPREECLREALAHLEQTHTAPWPEKLTQLERWYRDDRAMFDHTRQVSLELYTAAGLATQSYRNMMTDPRVALVFLDMAHSFELHCIAHVLHDDDTALTRYERDVIKYANAIHDYVHGGGGRVAIAVLYYVIDVFDNSPGGGRGTRITA